VDYVVRRIRREDWSLLRELRLAALCDTPLGFLESYDVARRNDDDEWRFRADRGTWGGRSATFVAEAADGTWVGMMGAFVDEAVEPPATTELRVATVVAVFVRPAWRGREHAVAVRLLAAVEGWARAEAAAAGLRLQVHEDNARALAFYRRMGFVETGDREPYELDPTRSELEMVRPLSATALRR